MVNQLKDTFEKFESQINGLGSSNWRQLRKEAFEAFAIHGFPATKNEEYRYTNLTRVLEKNFDLSDLSHFPQGETADKKNLFHDAEAIHILINNGILDKTKLSGLAFPDMEILTLQDASDKNASDIKNHLGKLAEIHHDPFATLNTAFSHDGVFIKIRKNSKVEKPIILHYNSGNASISNMFQTRNLIIVEEGAQVNIIESYSSNSTDQQFSNHVSEIVVDANAKLNYFKLQNQSKYSYHIDNTYISQYRDSVVKTSTITLEGKIIRNNLNYLLEDENCEAHMFGLYVLHGDSHVDNHTSVDHKKPNCYSNEIYKGILDNNAKGVFNGKIFVRKDAQKTNAFQTNKNILLTDTASINTKPQLEIWADDVSCSHGCTTGQLDEEQLFYLRSRGINKSSARAMLLHAFVDDVLDKIEIDFLHDFVHQEMYNRLDWNS